MILLISDLHLQEQRPDITRAFLHFLRGQASQAEALYILGDFFESWIGDDAMTPYQSGIAQALRRLVDGGTAVYLMHGNRDFLIGKRFCRIAGCQLLPDPCLVKLDGTPAVLTHGDLLCTRDRSYQHLRFWLRNPLTLWILRQLPHCTKQRLARWLRSQSQSQTRRKAAEIVDVTPEEVPRLLQKFEATTLIHGHTHRPARHPVRLDDGRTGERIVLGDWDKQGWVVEVDQARIKLKAFPIA